MVVFTVLNGTIVQGKGDYVYGHISSNELPIPKDPVDALFTYATSVKGEEETKILELTIEYIVNKQAQGTYLNPVWKIKDDSDKEYFFDLSGNVVV